MWNYFQDKWKTASLKARYQRMVQENLVDMVKESGPQPVAEDPGDWMLMGKTKTALAPYDRGETRDKVRELVRKNPHAKNILRLMEVYVVGPELQLTHKPKVTGEEPEERIVSKRANSLWKEFLATNNRHFSYREFARRTWRDGEAFLRGFETEQWPPTVRFIDPEQIAATSDAPNTEGIITPKHDVETPLYYLLVNPATGELLEQIPAEEVFHTKIGVDSNQKRGESWFLPIMDALASFNKWVDTEMIARKLQASIVLWRKVQGAPSQAAQLADSSQTSSSQTSSSKTTGESVRRERFAPGTILTTSHGTDLQYLHPNTNFGDAVPLGRLLLLCTSAGAGLPEFMLTSDASNANYSSTMVAEGPAVKMFQSEQHFFSNEFSRIWKWVMQEAVNMQLLPDDFLDQYQPSWNFPQLVNRDRSRERLADSHLVDRKILSRSEIARRDGVDPDAMQAELRQEEKELNSSTEFQRAA